MSFKNIHRALGLPPTAKAVTEKPAVQSPVKPATECLDPAVATATPVAQTQASGPPAPEVRFGATRVSLPNIPSGTPYIQAVHRDGVETQTPDYEVFFIGAIGGGGSGAHQSYIDLKLILETATPEQKITIFISSCGGDANTGFAVGSAMSSSAAQVETVGIGPVCSAGTVIWMAGKTRRMQPGSYLMQHMSSHMDWGNSAAMGHLATSLAAYIREVALEPLNRMGILTSSEVEDITERRKDIFLTAAEVTRRMTAQTTPVELPTPEKQEALEAMLARLPAVLRGMPFDLGFETAPASLALEGNDASVKLLPAAMHHISPAGNSGTSEYDSCVWKKDGVYRLSLAGYYLDAPEWVSHNVGGVIAWLRSLKEEDVVHISARSGGALTGVGSGLDWLLFYTPLLGAIRHCKAKTIFQIDHLLSSYEPYLAAACSDVEVSDFGGIFLTADLGIALQGTPAYLVVNEMLDILFANAGAINLFLADEISMVRDLRSVSISNKKLKERKSPPLPASAEQAPEFHEALKAAIGQREDAQ